MESGNTTTRRFGLELLRPRTAFSAQNCPPSRLDRRHTGLRGCQLPALLAAVLTAAFCLTGCNTQKTQAPQPLTNPDALNTLVWARKLTGTYYCGDSTLYGKAGGTFMKQETALDTGYQPDMGSYCAPSQAPSVAKPRADNARASRHGIG